jgi:hypothetical protein
MSGQRRRALSGSDRNSSRERELTRERISSAGSRMKTSRLPEQRPDVAPHSHEVILNAGNLAFLVQQSRAQV